MIWYYLVCFIIFMAIVAVLLFIREMKNAPLVPDTEPFLKGDCAPISEEYFKHYNDFCKNCKFFDETSNCTHEVNIGVIDESKTKICKEDGLFESK